MNENQCINETTEQQYISDIRENVHAKSDHMNCETSGKTLERQSNIKEHKNEHSGMNRFECGKCGELFDGKSELGEHQRCKHIDKPAEKISSCNKCDKTYDSMSKLRRHDWRCHREIECIICGENIASRKDIKSHKESKHKMFSKVFCKFFPNCIDEDECLYEHERNVHETENTICAAGENCIDQSCKFSEQSHMKKKRITLCKFQANCNRLNCSFKHIVERKSFLEVGSRNSKEK